MLIGSEHSIFKPVMSKMMARNVNCSEPQDIMFGGVQVLQNNKVYLAIYNCYNGHYGKGDMFRECNDNGNWTGSEPICLQGAHF